MCFYSPEDFFEEFSDTLFLFFASPLYSLLLAPPVRRQLLLCSCLGAVLRLHESVQVELHVLVQLAHLLLRLPLPVVSQVDEPENGDYRQYEGAERRHQDDPNKVVRLVYHNALLVHHVVVLVALRYAARAENELVGA